MEFLARRVGLVESLAGRTMSTTMKRGRTEMGRRRTTTKRKTMKKKGRTVRGLVQGGSGGGGDSGVQSRSLEFRSLFSLFILGVAVCLCHSSFQVLHAEGRVHEPSSSSASKVPPSTSSSSSSASSASSASSSSSSSTSSDWDSGEWGGSYPCGRGSVPFATYALLFASVIAFCGVATAALVQSGARGGGRRASSSLRCAELETEAELEESATEEGHFSVGRRWDRRRRRLGGVGEEEGGRGGVGEGVGVGGGARLRARVLLLVGLGALLRAALLSGMLALLLRPLLAEDNHHQFAQPPIIIITTTTTTTTVATTTAKSSIGITTATTTTTTTTGTGSAGLWPSPWQCAGVDVWGRVLLRFAPALLLLPAFLSVVRFLMRLHAAACLQRSALPTSVVRGAALAGGAAFALCGILTYRRATQHLFQRFACLLVGTMFAGTGLSWGVYGFLVLSDLKRRDLSFSRPLLSHHEEETGRVDTPQELLPEEGCWSSLSEVPPVAAPSFSHGVSSSSRVWLAVSESEVWRQRSREVERVSGSSSSAPRSRRDEAQARLLLLVSCCPPLLLSLGLYLIVVGAGGRHLYPRVVQRDHQQITFDLFLLLAAEFLPSLLVVAAFSSAAKRRNTNPMQVHPTTTTTTTRSLSNSLWNPHSSSNKRSSSEKKTHRGNAILLLQRQLSEQDANSAGSLPNSNSSSQFSGEGAAGAETQSLRANPLPPFTNTRECLRKTAGSCANV